MVPRGIIAEFAQLVQAMDPSRELPVADLQQAPEIR
jgi:hypothetical protein